MMLPVDMSIMMLVAACMLYYPAMTLQFVPPPKRTPLHSSLGRLRMVSSDDGIGAARAMLFEDQHRALNDQAEMEGKLLEPNMRPMKVLKKNRKHKSGGVGFGGGNAGPKMSKSEEKIMHFVSAVQKDGVVLVPGVMKSENALELRECLYKELEYMRDDVRGSPKRSPSYFYVPAEIHFSTPRGYVLLPFRDTESVNAESFQAGPIVDAARELLSPGAPLADLFGNVLDGTDSQLYDFCALRTEPGAARQPVHSDTPFQKTPGLYCAFVALQDVTMPMGGTLFFPKTQTQTAERLRFDTGAYNGERDEMLQKAKPQYTMLQAGDAVFFDMRTLHCGLPNLTAENGGANRLLLAVTFRNPKAKEDLGHKPNLRPGYVDMYTLGSFQQELASDTPFAQAGNGMVSTE